LRDMPATAFIESGAAISEDVGPSISTPQRLNRKPSKILMPLVFQEINLADLELNDQQIAAIEDLRAKFIEKIGGTNQDVRDPAYLDRWQESQPENDALLWWAVGKDIYQQFQLQAHAPMAQSISDTKTE